MILADPPWSYQNWSDAAHGAARSSFKTMTYVQIRAVPVSGWAHPHGCILALWATWPKLDEAMRLLNAWGFDYVTGCPWVKTSPTSGEIRCGVGFWFQSTSEVVLFGRRGSVKRNDLGNLGKRGLFVRGRPTSASRGLICGSQRQFYAPRASRHSQKPEDVQDYLEARFPGPRLELFARRERRGWTCWGLDTGWRLSKDGVAPSRRKRR